MRFLRSFRRHGFVCGSRGRFRYGGNVRRIFFLRILRSGRNRSGVERFFGLYGGLFFGALGMNYWQYLASSFVGILPTMVLYTVLGNDLDLTSTPVLICLGVDVACIAAAWLVLRLRKKRKGKKAARPTGGEDR